MKNIFKKFALVVLALAMVCALAGLVACGGGTGKTIAKYTVTVLDPDGDPYAGAHVQVCEINDNGSLGLCHEAVTANANGVANVEIEVARTDYVEVHLLELPMYYDYTAQKIHNGDAVTVQVKVAEGQSPESGAGTAEYLPGDNLTPADTKIKLDGFDPYVVKEHAYAVTFEEATQKIYYEFRTDYPGKYKVYSYGNVDASVSWLQGTKMTGITHDSDDEFNSDNISATDKNFSLQFTVDNGALEMGAVENNVKLASMYFEVALKDATKVNTKFLICFEFVDYIDNPQTDTQDVQPQSELSAYPAGVGNLVDVALDGSVTPVYNATDGYYHLNSASGPVLVATLGTDSQLNSNHQSDNVHVPRGYDVSLSIMCREHGHPFTVLDGNIRKNYYPLVAAYVEKSNANGVYGVTEELKGLLDVIINQILDKAWVLKTENPDNILSQVPGGKLPEGKEWLWACAYYDGEEVEPGASVDSPIDLLATEASAEEDNNQNEITVPASGKVYYSYYARGPVTLTLTSDSQKVKLVWYTSGSSSQTEDPVESTAEGFNANLTLNPQTMYILEFSTTDGAAATYTITATFAAAEAEEGSADNPIEITTLGEQTGNLIENECHFTYTVTEECVLYFKAGANTVIAEITYVIDDIPHQIIDLDELVQSYTTSNFKFAVGTKITITLNGADEYQGTAVSFEIATSPITD